MSKIEWTDDTWNPIVGCSVVSPGCTNCYAMKMARRLALMARAREGNSSHYAGLTQPSKAGAVWTGRVSLAGDETLTKPLGWKRPRRIFVNSMGDIFHEFVPDEWIDRVFAVMALSSQHVFQVLTKRSTRMREYMANVEREAFWMNAVANVFETSPTRMDKRYPIMWQKEPWLPLPNVCLGVSAEDQPRADERVPDLLATPAAVRFVSAEPLLGGINFRSIRTGERTEIDALTGFQSAQSGPGHMGNVGTMLASIPPYPLASPTPSLNWIIVGGESGPGARPMHPDWARSIRDQCAAAGVPYFFKQWGEFLPVGQCLPGAGKVYGATAVGPGRMKLHYRAAPKEIKYAFADKGVEIATTFDDKLTFRVGKGAAGRLLDGVEHNAMPETRR